MQTKQTITLFGTVSNSATSRMAKNVCERSPSRTLRLDADVILAVGLTDIRGSAEARWLNFETIPIAHLAY